MKSLLLAIFSALFPGLGKNGAILMYHSIDTNGLFFTTRPEEFERQMQYLKQKRLNVISLSEMCLRMREGRSVKNCVAITFDDGYSDFFKNAFPVLKKYNYPATVFIITGKLGSLMNPSYSKVTLKVMAGSEVKLSSSASDLIDFMPHTVTHPDLSKIPYEEAINEINESRKEVERLTRKPADIFAYPKGKFTPEIAEYLRKSDAWLGAVTVRAGLIKSSDDLFTLKRIPVDSATSFPVFKRKLSRGINLYQGLKPKK